MIRPLMFCLTCLATAVTPVWADTVVAARTIRAETIIEEADVTLRPGSEGDGFARLVDVLGLEARVVLYPGRPIRPADIGPPALVGGGYRAAVRGQDSLDKLDKLVS